LWGKRQLRSDIAEANAKATRSRQGSVTTALEERVKVAFAQYYQTDNAIRVTHEMHALLHTVSSTARTRYAQGLANQSDAIRADLETNRLDLEVATLERDEQMIRARINALVARPADSALSPPSELRPIPPTAALTLDELMARARPANPMLAATRAEIAAAKGEHQLVEKSYYPDVTVIVGFDDVPPNNSPRVVAGLGVKVPFQWGVRDAEARAASAKRAAAQRRLDGALLDIESELGSALATLRQTEKSRTVLKTVLSPQSEAAYRSALASYQLGRGDLTPVLEAAHRQLEIRIELLRVETDAQTALAGIERLVGEDL
jgi:outer membrane protein TolC